MTISKTRATIGRKVWYWLTNLSNAETAGVVVRDPRQAFDATVTFVHPNGNVQLNICDHAGDMMIDTDVELHDPEMDGDELMEQHGHGFKQGTSGYATWMPYQKKQEDKAKAEQEKAS